MLRYTVDDMTCAHCVQTVTKALHALDPEAKVSIDLDSKSVEVTTGARPQAVEGAIRGAGYTPTDASAGAQDNASCCGHCQ